MSERKYQVTGEWSGEYRVERLFDSAGDGRHLSVGAYPARTRYLGVAEAIAERLNAEAEGMTDEREAQVAADVITGQPAALLEIGHELDSVYVSVESGRWQVSATFEPGVRYDASFDGADLAGLARLFESLGVREVATSSSVDFPAEYEMPESTSADLVNALSW